MENLLHLEAQFKNLREHFSVKEICKMLGGKINKTTLWRQMNGTSALKFSTIQLALEYKVIEPIAPSTKLIVKKVRFYDI